MRHLLLSSILLAAALAGCSQGERPADADPAVPVPVAPDQALFADAIVNDHATGATGHVGHAVAELHAHEVGLELVAFDPLSEGLTVPGAGFTELHVVGDLAVVASLTGARGATLVDVSDAASPQVLSHITNLDDNWDARLSADQRYLFLGCQGSAAFDCTGVDTGGERPGTTGGGPCAPLATCPGGIAVYGVEDPSSPAFLGYLPMGFTHNLHTWQVDGVHYFANAVGNIGAFDPDAATFAVVSTEINAVHDVHVQKHPVTGQWLLYTGAGGEDGQMTIWDVGDPSAPVLVGAVDGPPAMWHEQTPMPCLIAGRHLTIGAGESGSGMPQAVAVVDTTDPTSPVVVGEWRLPGAERVTAQSSYRFSLHNIDGNCGGQVAVGHYHAGVWVFDVSTPERMQQPVTLGYYMPHERPVPSPAWSPAVTAPIGALVSADTPNVWTAQWSADGSVLFVPDMTTGLYVLAPTWAYEG